MCLLLPTSVLLSELFSLATSLTNKSLMKMTQFCGISVPTSVSERLHPIQHDDEAVKEIGCDICSMMCRTILKANNEDPNIDTLVDGFHFYTLNLERSTTRILIELDAADFISSRSASPSVLFERADSESNQQPDNTNFRNNINDIRRERGGSVSEFPRLSRRLLPWKPSTMENRSKEAIRPINWSNRPHSYVMRTDDWDEVMLKSLFKVIGLFILTTRNSPYSPCTLLLRLRVCA